MMFRLKAIRENHELTQKEVAAILHISKSNYNYFETTERFIPLKHLNNFCEYFHVSMDYALGLANINTFAKAHGTLDKVLIGKRIRYIRKMKGLTQENLAQIINTSQSTISAYENGNNLIITSFLYELCKRLDVSMDYITLRSNIIKIYNSSN